MLHQAIIIDKVKLNGRYIYVARTDEIFPNYYYNPFYDVYQGWNDRQSFINLTSTLDENCALTIKENANGGVTFGFTNTDDQFFGFSFDQYYGTFFFEYPDSYQNARLYKLCDTQEMQNEIDGFISVFLTQTANCDATGDSRRVFEQHWERLETEFGTLSADARGYLANLTYTHNAETSGTAKDIVDRYDYIISKYTDLWDFMDRKSASSYQNIVNPQPSSIISKLAYNYLPMTIVIIGVLSTSIVGAIIVFIRKRKEQ